MQAIDYCRIHCMHNVGRARHAGISLKALRSIGYATGQVSIRRFRIPMTPPAQQPLVIT